MIFILFWGFFVCFEGWTGSESIVALFSSFAHMSLEELSQRLAFIEGMFVTLCPPPKPLMLDVYTTMGEEPTHADACVQTDEEDAPCLHVNQPLVDSVFTDVTAYRAAAVAQLIHLRDNKGRRLVTTTRADAQSIIVRMLVYLNRPSCFVHSRWPTLRPVFETMDELQLYLSTNRDLILDFYNFSRTGKISSANAPCVKTALELNRPYQKRNILRGYLGVFLFGSREPILSLEDLLDIF